jgi:3-methyladenine DNA glycosylase AlkD
VNFKPYHFFKGNFNSANEKMRSPVFDTKTETGKLAKVYQDQMTAKQFTEKLSGKKSAIQAVQNAGYFKDDSDKKNKFLGVRFKTIFDTAKEFVEMPLNEIEKLLESPYHEIRMGAVSIMDFKARGKKTSEETKKQLFDLYIRRHDRINNWDLVDRSAPHVVGAYLFDKPRKILYKLAKSKNVWERRTAIVSTYYFIKNNDLDETFKIAALLVKDKHDLVQKAVGSWIREAGKRDKHQLLNFLDEYSAVMPRTMLRYAIEKLDKKQKEFYMKKA